MGRHLTKQVVALGLLTLCELTSCKNDDDTPLTTTASANLVNTNGATIGLARFSQSVEGPLSLTVTATGLPPGQHGIHFHEVGIADPNASLAFGTAGGHYNPSARQHGLDNPNGTHGGDLANLTADAQGNVNYTATTDRVTLTAGSRTLLDANGSALIIHANADHQKTDPSGNSGGRIAGGVVTKD
jgi:Cu-Zn family superoxide dismutase